MQSIRFTITAIIMAALTMPALAAGDQKIKFERAIAANNAKAGGFLASAPKIKPDSELYYLSGKIQQAVDGAAFLANLSPSEENELLANVLRRSRGMGESTDYFAVVVPRQIEEYYLNNGQIGGGFDLIGRYASNTEYRTVSGREVQAPVFEAVYLDLWASRKINPAIASLHQRTPPLGVYERCIESSGGVMPAMVECSTAEASRQDARLNAAYKAAMAATSNKIDLRNRQREWIKERDIECAIDNSGGQAATLNAIECEIRKTSNRANTLEAIR